MKILKAEEEVYVVSVTVYKGDLYCTWDRGKIDNEYLYRDDYIRITWDTGFIDIQKYQWDKIYKKQKDLLFPDLSKKSHTKKSPSV